MLKAVIPHKVTYRLLFIFSFAAIIITIAGILIYRELENRTRHEVYSELSTLAQFKIREVINWRQERINDANFIYNNYEFKRLVSEFFSNPSNLKAKDKIAQYIKSLKENHEYIDIILIDLSGKKYPLFSDAAEQIQGVNKEYFLKAINEKKVLLTDLNRDSAVSGTRIHLSSFIPVFSSNNSRLICVVEIKIDPTKILFPSIQMISDRHKTSEFFIVRREKDSVLFLNDLKYMKNSALNFRQPLSKKDLPAAMAVLGKTGIFEGKDYRGIPVIADLRKISNSPWYTVSKIDKDELYSPLQFQSALITVFVIILILLCGIGVYAIWKQQQLKYFEESLQSEIERQNLQARIDYLIKNANDVIILSDDKGRIIQVNDKAILSYGYSLKEFCDLTIDSIRAEYTRAAADSDREKVKENDGYIFETVHIKRNGTHFPVEVSSRIIEVEGKKYFQSLIRDITERKSYEERLTKTISELNRSNKDLEQFAYVASHDLQEPLRMVHTFSQLLNKNNFDKLDDNSKQYISFLTEGAQRMQQLIQALLTYSRLNASSGSVAEVNCNEVLKDAVENLKLKIEESNASIVSPVLPTLKADHSQMVQLFQNLLSNALKYRGLNNPEIRIMAEEGPEEWLFSIHDNGIGIHSEYYEKIFLIFQRLHDREKYEGTGIGLTICKRIVERHGGRIWVESEPDKGSVFHFSIRKL